MGTLTHIIPGAYSGAFVGYDPAVTDGLLHWHFGGVSEAAANTNLLEGGQPGVTVGAPTHSGSFSFFQGGTSYQRMDGATQVAKMSAVAVFQAPLAPVDNNNRALTAVGNSFLTTGGWHLGVVGTNQLRAGMVTEAGIVNASLALADPLQWVMAAGLFDGGVGVRVHNLTAGTTALASSASPAVLSAERIRAGSNQNTYLGGVRMAFWAVYNRVLTTAELALIRTQVQAYCAGLPAPITGF